MLLAVVALFLVCNTLAFVTNIIELWLQPPYPFEFTILVDVSNTLVHVNAAFSFLVYYIFGTKFRTIFRSYFLRKPSNDSDNDTNDDNRWYLLGLKPMLICALVETVKTVSDASPIHLQYSKRGSVESVRHGTQHEHLCSNNSELLVWLYAICCTIITLAITFLNSFCCPRIRVLWCQIETIFKCTNITRVFLFKPLWLCA
jgi:hypothetical protein